MARVGPTVTAAITVILASVSVTGCGSSTPTKRATSGQRASQAGAPQSGLSYARCMRSHGVSRFPDPTATGGFDPNAAGINQSSPAVKAAETACARLLPVKHVPFQEPTAAAYRRLLHWARCMRAHGISSLPDPKPNPPPSPGSAVARAFGTLMGDGGYWVGIPSNVNAHSPAFFRLSSHCGESPN